MAKASDRTRGSAPLGKKLDELYGLIEGIEIAMFTTRRADGHLVSRPMATQTQAEGSDLYDAIDSISARSASSASNAAASAASRFASAPVRPRRVRPHGWPRTG